MANVLQMVRDKITGGDDVDALMTQIADTRSAGIRGHAELEKLEAARLAAASYDEARAIDEQIAACRWAVEHAAAQLQTLESRLSIALAARNRKALSRHQDIARKILPRLISAVKNAAEIQAEAMAARDAAVAELGESAVSVNIEPIAYLGLLTPQFVTAWSDSMKKRLAAAEPQPAVAAVAKVPQVATPKPAAKPVVPVAPVAPAEPAKARRPLRNDLLATEGRRRVKFHRSNIELEDGTLSRAGDIVSVPASVAEKLIEHGGADYAQAPTAGKGN
jgi:hypothetical protein